MLPLFLVLSCAEPAAAQDTNPSPAMVAQEVHEVAEDISATSTSLDAIEQFLEDKQMAADGKAPKDWVQPELDVYKALAVTGRCTSLIPGLAEPVTEPVPEPQPDPVPVPTTKEP